MKQNQFTQAAEDLSKLEVELFRAGYRNTTHNGTGTYADALGLLWDRASKADNMAECLCWESEEYNDRSTQFWAEYHGWVAVVKQLVIAEAEIEDSYSEAEQIRIESEMAEWGTPRTY